MLAKVTSVLPFWKSISCYSSHDRWKALPKFLIFWVISLSPLFLAAVLQQIPEKESVLGAICRKIVASFLARHQFIYAVSFITPIFYFFWERDSGLLKAFLSGKRSPAGLKLTPPGFGVVLIWSIFFFAMTTVTYAVTESHPKADKTQTILEAWSEIITVVVYLFGLVCWYFMILDGSASPIGDYYDQLKKDEAEEEKKAQDFSDRIAKSEGDGE